MKFLLNVQHNYIVVLTLKKTPADSFFSRFIDLLNQRAPIRKQPPRPINEISVRRGGGYLNGKCVISVRGIGVFWKIVCVRGLNRASWNKYLFDEKIEAPGKFVCVRTK